MRELPAQDGAVGADADDEAGVRRDFDAFDGGAVTESHVRYLTSFVIPHLQQRSKP